MPRAPRSKCDDRRIDRFVGELQRSIMVAERELCAANTPPACTSGLRVFNSNIKPVVPCAAAAVTVCWASADRFALKPFHNLFHGLNAIVP